ncbi:metallophosphoesterase [Pseudomonas borbori]|uniref:Predicted phosphoesterase n=1 Tax=Pseudomonas borbori TaxID=289003 RepID=A0A1I5X3E4_9PSED|nr:metallophosphoesterase [Pseudomonas borbori]SFQ26346.1 Predicted phosphoesterase [Pseudomonas borbori]
MKLAILSDLHLSVAGMEEPNTDCDVVILAGDLGRPQQAIRWAKQFSQPVIFIPGNHEFYGASLTTTLTDLKQAAHDSNVHVLEREEVCIDGVRFLGCTLWTDFRLFATESETAAAITEAHRTIRDFSRITLSDDSPTCFSPAHSSQIFNQSVDWLTDRFSKKFNGSTVVITHHAPSPSSINPKYTGSLLNACFVSNLDDQIVQWSPTLWVHGHTHNSCDYQIGNTRILSNPRGYAREGIPENMAFNPFLTIQV